MTYLTTEGKCAVCGKPIIIRSTRDHKAQYCSRVCASQARYRSRYVGTRSGPADRPSIEETSKLPRWS